MAVYAVVSWLIIGLAVGAASKLLYPGQGAGDWLGTMVVSVMGALLDGWGSAHVLGHDRGDGIANWVAALVGAVIMVTIYRFVLRRNLML